MKRTQVARKSSLSRAHDLMDCHGATFELESSSGSVPLNFNEDAPANSTKKRNGKERARRTDRPEQE